MKVEGELLVWKNEHIERALSDGSNDGQEPERPNDSHLLFRGAVVSEASDATPQSHLLAYSVPTALSERDVATVVDNVRFSDSSVDSCQWFCRAVLGGNGSGSTGDDDGGGGDAEQHEHGRLVLVFGPESGNPQLVRQALLDVGADDFAD